MLVGLYGSCIQGQVLQLSPKAQYPEDIIKDPALNPLEEAAVYRIPEGVAFRKVTPLRAIQTIPLSMVRLSFGGCLGFPVFSEGVKMQPVPIPGR